MGIEDVIRARARMPSAPDLPPSYDSIVPQTCRPQVSWAGNHSILETRNRVCELKAE